MSEVRGQRSDVEVRLPLCSQLFARSFLVTRHPSLVTNIDAEEEFTYIDASKVVGFSRRIECWQLGANGWARIGLVEVARFSGRTGHGTGTDRDGGLCGASAGDVDLAGGTR